MKKLFSTLAVALAFAFGVMPSAHAAGAAADCAAKSAEKKLAGAAKNSFEKKCIADAGGATANSPTCEKSAADKKLAGAAKSSHLKKCMADEKAGAKPMADAKPKGDAKPVAEAKGAAAAKPIAVASAAKK